MLKGRCGLQKKRQRTKGACQRLLASGAKSNAKSGDLGVQLGLATLSLYAIGGRSILGADSEDFDYQSDGAWCVGSHRSEAPPNLTLNLGEGL